MTIVLRPATVADVATLTHWDRQPHVIAALGDDEGIDWADELTRDGDAQQTLIAELDGRPIGLVQITDPAREETHYWGDVEPDLRAIDIWIGDADRPRTRSRHRDDDRGARAGASPRPR